MKYFAVAALIAISMAWGADPSKANTLCTFSITDINFGDINLIDNATIAATGFGKSRC